MAFGRCLTARSGLLRTEPEVSALREPAAIAWSNDLTDAQLRMVMQSGDHDGASGYGVELAGAGQWATARSLEKAGLGWIEGGAPNGSSLSGLYFNNRDGVEITHEFDENKDDDWQDHCGNPDCDMCPPFNGERDNL
jgi:hypothetical protein